MSDIAEIGHIERLLCAAMLAGDVDALEQLIGNQAVFTNQLGQRLSKADDIAAHQSGVLRFGYL